MAEHRVVSWIFKHNKHVSDFVSQPSPKNRACGRVGRQRVASWVLFQRPPSELLVTLSMSSSSPVDGIPLSSGSCASRTLPLLKCRPPVSLRHVIGSPNLRLLRRLRDLETRVF